MNEDTKMVCVSLALACVLSLAANWLLWIVVVGSLLPHGTAKFLMLVFGLFGTFPLGVGYGAWWIFKKIG